MHYIYQTILWEPSPSAHSKKLQLSHICEFLHFEQLIHTMDVTLSLIWQVCGKKEDYVITPESWLGTWQLLLERQWCQWEISGVQDQQLSPWAATPHYLQIPHKSYELKTRLEMARVQREGRMNHMFEKQEIQCMNLVALAEKMSTKIFRFVANPIRIRQKPWTFMFMNVHGS